MAATVVTMSEIGLPRSASENPLRPPHQRPIREGEDSLIQVSLHHKKPSIGQYHSTCISKHYSLNDQILAAFEAHNQQRLYNVAFHFGLKFVETALLEIPKHGYFYTDKFADFRIRSSHEALRVTSQLQEILALEPDALSKEFIKVERLHFLATELCERLHTYEGHRAQVQMELNIMNKKESVRLLKRKSNPREMISPFRKKSSGSIVTQKGLTSSLADCDVRSTLLACGESISSVFCPTVGMTSKNANLYPPIPSSHHQDASLSFFPDSPTITRSRTAPSKLYPPSQQGMEIIIARQAAATNEDYPPSPEPLMKQTSLMDDEDDDDDDEEEENQRSMGEQLDDSCYTYGSRIRVNPTTVYLHEEDEPPPSYRDIFKLYDNDTNKAEEQKDEREIIIDERNVIGTPGLPNREKRTKHYSSWSSSSLMDPSGHLRTQSDIDLERALYLSGLEVMTDIKYRQQQDTGRVGLVVTPDDEDDQGGESKQGDEHRDDAPPIFFHDESFLSDDSSTIPAPPGVMRRQTASGVAMSMLRNCYREDFQALETNGRIIISEVPTFQGRIVGSTNGCTVIAPLMCMHHFHNVEELSTTQGAFNPDPPLSDQVIVQVIDEETPNILATVRKNLGLAADAFLIPSDAHESLMDQQLLSPEQFLTVCGGNILEEAHLDPLLEQLSKVGPKKIAATLFFHEHVIAIMQLRQSETIVWFDIIDSLPHRATLQKMGPGVDPLRSESSGRCGFGSQQVLPGGGSTSSDILSDEEWVDLERSEMQSQQLLVDSIPSIQNAARIRCLDPQALKAALKWYACSVFSPENVAYIDTYEWDEKLPDFDPRVFQAFVWQEA